MGRWAGSTRDRVMTACGTKPGSSEDYPFGDGVAVFKVAGRMFALVPLGPAPGSVSLKCDPGLAADLRGRYAAITPGYHLNKRHWNTVALDGSVPEEEVLELVDHSDDLVLAPLTRAQRNKLITCTGRRSAQIAYQPVHCARPWPDWRAPGSAPARAASAQAQDRR